MKKRLLDMEEKLKLTEELYESLLNLEKAGYRSKEEILDSILAKTIEITKSKIGYIYFYDEDSRQLSIYSWSRDVMKECRVMNPETVYDIDKTGLWGEAIRQRKPIITNHYLEENEYKKGTPIGHVALIRHLNVPIFQKDKIVALIGVANKETDYDDYDIKFLNLLMNNAFSKAMRFEMESKLKDRETLYRRTFESAANGIVHSDKEGRLISANRKFCDILGYEPDEVIGMTVRDITLEEDYEADITSVRKILAGEINEFSLEKRYIKKDGSFTWVNLTVSLIDGIEEGDARLLGIVQEINEKKKAELELEIYKANLEKLIEDRTAEINVVNDEINLFFNTTLDMLCVAGFDGYFKKISPTWTKVLGWSSDDLLSRPFVDFVHEDDKASTIEAAASLGFGKDVISFENRYRCSNGEYKWIQWNSFGFPERSIIIAAARDITEKKESEENLRKAMEEAEKTAALLKMRNEELLLIQKDLEREKNFVTRMMEVIPIAVAVVDSNGDITYANNRSEEVLGIKVKETEHRAYDAPEWKAIRVDGTPFLDEDQPFVKVMNAKAPVQGVLQGILWPDGRRRVLSINGTPQMNKAGEVEWVAFAMLDITEQIEYEATLKDAIEIAEHAKREADTANRAKGEFLANMSHEIRTPLNAVIGFSELLQKELSESKYVKYVESINTAGKSLLMLINDILDLSKIEAGMMELRLSPTNPKVIFREIEQIFRQNIESKGLELFIDVEEMESSILLLDELRLRQILLNLVGNAVKFTNTGWVKLSVKEFHNSKKGKDYVNLLFYVEDTGIGIRKEEQQLIFESFKQQSGQSNRKYEGTGLGLSISAKLAEMMNGRIEVNSTFGKGSTFILHLEDIERVQGEVEPEPAVLVRRMYKFDRKIVLLVDDVEINRVLVSEMLKNSGVELHFARDGQEAVALSKELKPDLILMDIVMPIMDGVEAAKKIKKNPVTSKVPVVAFTASVISRDSGKKEYEIFDGFIIKPIETEHLYEAMAGFLKVESVEITNKEIETDIKSTGKSALVDELRLELRESVSPLVSRLRKSLKRSDTKKLAETLIAIAEKYSIAYLESKGQKLQEASNNVDITAMKKLIEQLAVWFEENEL